MATNITEMIDVLTREVNPPGFEQFPDALPSDFLGYIEDGFWEGRLLGFLPAYTVVDGGDLTPPESGTFITNDDEDDLPEEFQSLIAILAGFRLLRAKALNLAQSFRAQAGPVEYQQEVSATVLREILRSLERRIEELKTLHSDTLGESAFFYMDGALQREQALVEQLYPVS